MSDIEGRNKESLGTNVHLNSSYVDHISTIELHGNTSIHEFSLKTLFIRILIKYDSDSIVTFFSL